MLQPRPNAARPVIKKKKGSGHRGNRTLKKDLMKHEKKKRKNESKLNPEQNKELRSYYQLNTCATGDPPVLLVGCSGSAFWKFGTLLTKFSRNLPRGSAARSDSSCRVRPDFTG